MAELIKVNLIRKLLIEIAGPASAGSIGTVKKKNFSDAFLPKIFAHDFPQSNPFCSESKSPILTITGGSMKNRRWRSVETFFWNSLLEFSIRRPF